MLNWRFFIVSLGTVISILYRILQFLHKISTSIGYIPKIFQNQYVLLGISFSEKSGIYLLAAQLFFSDGWESMVASLIALSFGFLYSQNIVRIQQFRLPSVVEVRFLK